MLLIILNILLYHQKRKEKENGVNYLKPQNALTLQKGKSKRQNNP